MLLQQALVILQDLTLLSLLLRCIGCPCLLQEILTDTEREVGSNKGISQKPIRLKIFSPNVL